ncbi:MAG: LytTR family transcriptional regulator DNA-binding domain-containing protein, partial [Lachnospiraceae bacterium]
MADLEKFFKRNKIEIEKILYIYHHDRKTVVCHEPGGEVFSSAPLQEVLAFLPEEDFISISRNAIVRRDKILNISHEGVYTMLDGKTFQGRTRYLSTHRRLKKEMESGIKKAGKANPHPLSFLEKCSILDDMPVAYCVIELTFDEDGHGVDFIFRYCNKYMEVVEGIPVEEMLNRSFYEVFRNGDRKWLVSYADVALNGSKRTLSDYSPEIDKNLTIYCYQPEPGFCACVLVPEQ